MHLHRGTTQVKTFHLTPVLVVLVALAMSAGIAWGQPTVAPGFDLLETQDGTIFLAPPPLPPLLTLDGVPLITFDLGMGLQFVGNTDTIIERLAAASVPAAPGTAAPIPIELIALQLVSTNASPPFFITLSSIPPSTGTMTITFDDANSGTFSSMLDVWFDVRTDSPTGPILIGGLLKTLTASGVPWDRTPPPGAILLAGKNWMLNGVDNSQDFFPDPFQESDPDAIHVVSTTTIAPDQTHRWTFAGTAKGGTVSADINGCTVTIPTTAGESSETVAANFADAVNADACLSAQSISAMASGNNVDIIGPGVNVTDTDVNDSGLLHNPVPTLGEWGLIALVLLLLAAGVTMIRRKQPAH